MVRARVRFMPSGGLWMKERGAVWFSGETDLGTVEILITTKALIQLLNPGLTTLDRDAALETFVEFEADIHRIAQRELVKGFGGEPPTVITAADVQG